MNPSRGLVCPAQAGHAHGIHLLPPALISWGTHYLLPSCPTECRLIYSDEPWRCIVSLRFISDEYGTPLNDICVEQFGDPIFTRTDVTDRIRRAQRAILNPNTSCFDFVDAEDGELQENELTFSANYVCLEIRGRDLADLTFVDLPGMFSCPIIVRGEPIFIKGYRVDRHPWHRRETI